MRETGKKYYVCSRCRTDGRRHAPIVWDEKRHIKDFGDKQLRAGEISKLETDEYDDYAVSLCQAPRK
jgi:uncharacterized CHY-type Zn-finger protein